jgi:hypothetical protein
MGAGTVAAMGLLVASGIQTLAHAHDGWTRGTEVAVAASAFVLAFVMGGMFVVLVRRSRAATGRFEAGIVMRYRALFNVLLAVVGAFAFGSLFFGMSNPQAGGRISTSILVGIVVLFGVSSWLPKWTWDGDGPKKPR